MLHCIEKREKNWLTLMGIYEQELIRHITEVVNFLSSFLPYKEHNAAALAKRTRPAYPLCVKGITIFQKEFITFGLKGFGSKSIYATHKCNKSFSETFINVS